MAERQVISFFSLTATKGNRPMKWLKYGLGKAGEAQNCPTSPTLSITILGSTVALLILSHRIDNFSMQSLLCRCNASQDHYLCPTCICTCSIMPHDGIGWSRGNMIRQSPPLVLKERDCTCSDSIVVFLETLRLESEIYCLL